MTVEAALKVFYSGMSIAVVVWILGLVQLLKMRAMQPSLEKTGVIKDKTAADCVGALLKIVLDRGGRIVERAEKSALVEVPSLMAGGTQGTQTGGAGTPLRIDARFEDRYGGTEYKILADFTRIDRLYGRIMSILVLGLAPIVLGGVFFLMWKYVLPSDMANVRAQAFQVIQTIHVMWPPFLIAFLHRRIRGAAETFADNIATHIEVTGA